MRRHWLGRPLDDPNYVLGELELVTTAQAEAVTVARQELWSSRAATPALVGAPELRIVEAVEEHSYTPDLRHAV